MERIEEDLQIDLFVKPTDSRSYPKFGSTHLNHVFGAIVHPQSLRLRKIMDCNQRRHIGNLSRNTKGTVGAQNGHVFSSSWGTVGAKKHSMGTVWQGKGTVWQGKGTVSKTTYLSGIHPDKTCTSQIYN